MRNAAAVLDINLLVGRLRQVDADGGAAATATAATAAATIAATAATRGRLALLCGAAAVVRRWGAPLLRSDVVAGILNEFDVRANHVAPLGLRETRDDGLAESSGNFFKSDNTEADKSRMDHIVELIIGRKVQHALGLGGR